MLLAWSCLHRGMSQKHGESPGPRVALINAYPTLGKPIRLPGHKQGGTQPFANTLLKTWFLPFFESRDCTGDWPRRSHLIFFSTSLFVVLQDVVPHVILGVDQELLGVALLLPAFHPHHEEQHHGCKSEGAG